jgi:uncharacterized protein with HEPN domain
MTAETTKADFRTPDYLEHMLEACDRVLQYTTGMTITEFLANTLVQDAVLRNIEILGEATKNLLECAPEYTAVHPEIPWIDIYGMRNRIAHGYFFINFEMVWSVVSVRIPSLRSEIADLLKSEPGFSLLREDS